MTNALKGDLGYSFIYRPVCEQHHREALSGFIPGSQGNRDGFPTGIFLGTVAARKERLPTTCVSSSLSWAFHTQFHPNLSPSTCSAWPVCCPSQAKVYAHDPTHFAMSLGMIAGETRSMRASALEVASGLHHIAKAKGLSARQVVWRHQIRNALPALTGWAFVPRASQGFSLSSRFCNTGLGLYYTNAIRR